MSNIQPAGGVIHNNTASWLIEDILHDSISLEYEEHEKTCTEYTEDDNGNRYHDNCYFCDNETLIKGFIKNSDGLYEPDPNAEYSAIMGEVYTQVVQSKWYTLCRPCSPCYPYQNNLDDPGDYETYSLPPDLYDAEHDKVPEIKRIDQEE